MVQEGGAAATAFGMALLMLRQGPSTEGFLLHGLYGNGDEMQHDPSPKNTQGSGPRDPGNKSKASSLNTNLCTSQKG